MSVRLSAAIMAHPKRADMVERLQSELDRPVPVVWDEINDRHDTGIRAVQAADPNATHHLVIQDDVAPCRDLLTSIEAALAHVPDGCPASFYLGRVQPFRQQVTRVTRAAGDASWIVMDGVYWGPAIVVPAASVPDLVAWWSHGGRRITNYDRRLSGWFESQNLRCWYSWPSLVEHRGDESLVRTSKAIRTAHRFIGADASGLDVDWSGPVADLWHTARLDRRRQRSASRLTA
jgi:hypothetical protein